MRGQRLWGWAAAGLCASLLGCKATPGTFVLVEFQGSVAEGRSIQSIEVGLVLDPQDESGARSDWASFFPPDGSKITLPTTATLVIRGGEGFLTVSAKALDQDGNVIGKGSASQQIKAKQTTSVVVTLGPSLEDGGSDGSRTDAQGKGDALPAATDAGSAGGSGAGGAGGAATGGQTGGGSGGAGGVSGTFQITLLPTAIDFGTVAVGTTSPLQVMTIKNVGSVPTPILQVSAADPAQFPVKEDHCSSGALRPGDSCTVSFAFVPGAAGSRDTTGKVGFAAGAGPSITFPLIGTGMKAAGSLTLSPPAVDFKTLDVGTSSFQPFTLTNNGSDEAANPRIVVTGPAFFQVTDNQCANGSLAPRGQCTFSITFAPEKVGQVTATVAVEDLSGGGTSGSSLLSGTGRRLNQLQVQFTGPGGGTVSWPAVRSWPGNSIHSGSPFSTGVEILDPVDFPQFVLTATPDNGSQFGGWGGDCSGTGTCTLGMNSNRTVIANFVLTSSTQGPLTISVLSYGGQQGSVTSADGTIRCSGHCPGLSYPTASSLTLLAKPGQNATFIGWSEGPCHGTNPSCTFPANGTVTVAATFGPPSYMFVSSAVYVPGQLGGIAGADAKCQGLAVSARLPGTYKAWLSSKGTDARSRVGAGGWVRTDGRPFARNIDTLAFQNKQTVYYPPRVDESGKDLGNVHTYVVTGGLNNGTGSDSQCSDYTSPTGGTYVGDAAAGSYLWAMSQLEPQGCGGRYHLYCFRSDAPGADFTPAPVSGRRVFVSAGRFVPGPGPGHADALCRADAAAANLTDASRFVAFLATNSIPAMKRVIQTTAAWKRVDDVVVARSTADLAGGQLLAPLGLTADGSAYTTFNVWTGANDPISPGSATCSDWTFNASSSSGLVGNSGVSVKPDWFSLANTSATACSDTNTHLICIEP